MEETKGFAQTAWADIPEEGRLALIQETIDRMERERPTNHPESTEEDNLFRLLLTARADVEKHYARMYSSTPGEGRR